MAVTDSLIDSVFDRRYRIVRKLGSGGMADVYLAEDQELGRRVAIKILNEKHAVDQQFVERFRMEASNAARLSHPNIVSIYDRGEAAGTYYIAMEYLEGKTLKELILERGASPVGIAVDYARQILAALRFAHRNGLVHRDIKPHNVVVDPEGRLKVTDFGIARAGASEMTEAGSIIGTAQYLSPEQARGVVADERSDLYSVGVVLYELLTGSVPFTGERQVEIAMKHISTVPEKPSRRRPPDVDPVPPALDSIVLRALAKRPDDRYQTAEQMDAELARIARGQQVSRETEAAATAVLSGAGVSDIVERTAVIRPQGDDIGGSTRIAPPSRPPRRRRRSWWPWLLGLGAVLALAAGGWYAYTQIQRQLDANKLIPVELYKGMAEQLASARVQTDGLVPRIVRQASERAPKGDVYDQSPIEGEKVAKGSTVTLYVSTGKPKTTVPTVKGMSVAVATGLLANAGLQTRAVEIDSGAPPNTVTASDPPAGATVVRGTVVRINVSRGPAPIPVPSVTGELYDQANSDLQTAGFTSTRIDVDSTVAANTVIKQDPAGGSKAPKGSNVTLTVSKGPPLIFVPDVTTQTEADATQNLQASGFAVSVQYQETPDPTQDGVVLSLTPPGGSTAPPGSTVTIVVGQFVAPPVTTPAPTPTPTPGTTPTPGPGTSQTPAVGTTSTPQQQ